MMSVMTPHPTLRAARMAQRFASPLLALSLLLTCVSCEERAKPLPSTPPHDAQAVAAPQKRAGAGGADASFTLQIAEVSAEVGKPAQATVEVLPGSGLKINPDFPWKLVLDTPPEGLTLEGTTTTLPKSAMQLDAARARLPLTLTASQPGAYALEGSLNLSVCEAGNAARCLWFNDEPVQIKVVAAAPAEAPEAPPVE